MSNSAGEAINSFKRRSMAFNERDARGMVAEMHFPHIRLVGTTFQTWVNSDDFYRPKADMSAALSTEGWHKTISKSITPVQVGDEKVHLVIRQSSQTPEGIEYNGFDTMWVFTKI